MNKIKIASWRLCFGLFDSGATRLHAKLYRFHEWISQKVIVSTMNIYRSLIYLFCVSWSTQRHRRIRYIEWIGIFCGRYNEPYRSLKAGVTPTIRLAIFAGMFKVVFVHTQLMTWTWSKRIFSTILPIFRCLIKVLVILTREAMAWSWESILLYR